MDIDIVVLWVDGNDSKWLAEKRMFDSSIIDDSNTINRYRDNGLMKYWFRSIEKNISWFRMIHFVTWGHLPEFLNVKHPKLHIVKHSDFMPEGSLPTYNACALEMNIFKIYDLSEHFIYFNDDMFILRSLNKDAFFSPDGFPCQQYTELPIMFKGNPEVWQMLAANDAGIINKYFDKKKVQTGHFNKYFNKKYTWFDNLRSICLKLLFPHIFTGFKNFHAPAPYCKKTFQVLWEKEPELLMETSCHKFRNFRDVNQWLALWWQLVEGNFIPYHMNSATFSADDQSVEIICQAIRTNQYDMICINDPDSVNDFETVSQKMKIAFETILPEKCSFEI